MNLPMKNETIINAKKGFTLNLKEFWLYRELLYFLAWRDLKVRYKQTVLGALWAVIQPFVTMFIFSIFLQSGWDRVRGYPLSDFCFFNGLLSFYSNPDRYFIDYSLPIYHFFIFYRLGINSCGNKCKISRCSLRLAIFSPNIDFCYACYLRHQYFRKIPMAVLF